MGEIGSLFFITSGMRWEDQQTHRVCHFQRTHAGPAAPEGRWIVDVGKDIPGSKLAL